jgi:hypothetical protein
VNASLTQEWIKNHSISVGVDVLVDLSPTRPTEIANEDSRSDCVLLGALWQVDHASV